MLGSSGSGLFKRRSKTNDIASWVKRDNLAAVPWRRWSWPQARNVNSPRSKSIFTASESLSRKMRSVKVSLIRSPSSIFACVDGAAAAMIQRNKKGRSRRRHSTSSEICKKAKYLSMWVRNLIKQASGDKSKVREEAAADEDPLVVDRGEIAIEVEAGGVG
jgi:hypothetical protein